MSNKKAEVILKEQVIAGAKVEQEKRHAGHTHVLMGIRLNLLEISHRSIEHIEKQRFVIMNKYDGDEAVEKFKDMLFTELTK